MSSEIPALFLPQGSPATATVPFWDSETCLVAILAKEAGQDGTTYWGGQYAHREMHTLGLSCLFLHKGKEKKCMPSFHGQEVFL